MYSTEQQLLGIAGNAGSGKDSVGDILQDAFDFTHISCSNLLREYITAQGLGPLDRVTMTRIAFELRRDKGASFLVDHCLERYASEEKLAIGSIYSPAEAERIKTAGGQVLLIVCNDSVTRYQRITQRNAARDAISYEQFLGAEASENSGDSTQQDVAGIAGLADYEIHNEGTIDELYAALSALNVHLSRGKNARTTA